jgi:hypothetical protein
MTNSICSADVCRPRIHYIHFKNILKYYDYAGLLKVRGATECTRVYYPHRKIIFELSNLVMTMQKKI